MALDNYRPNLVRDRRVYTVDAAYVAAGNTINLSITKGQVYDAATTTDPGAFMSIHYSKMGIQVTGVGSPALTIEASFDGSNFAPIPETLVHNTNATKNIIPAAGGIAIIEGEIPMFIRLNALGGLAGNACVVRVHYYGVGEVGKSSTART